MALTIGELQDAVDVEITTYLERAQRVQAANGQVSIAECLTDDDLAALRQAATIFLFAATLATSWGDPREEIEATAGAAGTALSMVRDLTDPNHNWREN